MKPTRRKKRKKKTLRVIIVSTALVLAILFIVLLFTVDGFSRPSNIVSVVVNPVISLINNTFSGTTDRFKAFKSNKDLIRENNELKQQIEQLNAKLILADVYLEEINEYKELLNLQKELLLFELISAKIVFSTVGNVQTGLTINKGVSAGIRPGMPVLFGDKLLGIVKDSDLISARVRTIYEKDFSIIARNTNNHELYRIRGDSTAYRRQSLICDYLPVRSEIKVGDILETSALGDTYPNSIKIGVVERIDHDRDGIPVKAYVRPYIDPRQIDFVFVLNYKDSDGEQDGS